MDRIKDKVAIVTACTRGIGRAIADRFAEEGAIVYMAVRRMDAGQEIADAHNALGRRVKAVYFDGDILETIEPMVNQVYEAEGRIDILVNNAGLIRREDALAFSEKDWDDVMNLNIKSVFFMSQAAAKHFIAQGSGGKIINIASMLSFQGGIRVPSYTASKSAVMGVTRLLANEWAKHNINVNAIAPGYMATNNTQQLRADEQRSSEILDRIPAGRWGLPADLMGPVVFLASPASDYINGYTVAVDGGWLAR